ncbi:hypothetical protein [Alcanivorax sp.]|nr:hypothetical protein [Alcanivorax sp.]
MKVQSLKARGQDDAIPQAFGSAPQLQWVEIRDGRKAFVRDSVFMKK